MTDTFIKIFDFIAWAAWKHIRWKCYIYDRQIYIYIYIYIKILAQVFSCEFCGIFKNTFSYRTPLVAASAPESIKNWNCDKNEIAKHCWEADLNFSWDQKKFAGRVSRLIPKKIKQIIYNSWITFFTYLTKIFFDKFRLWKLYLDQLFWL